MFSGASSSRTQQELAKTAGRNSASDLRHGGILHGLVWLDGQLATVMSVLLSDEVGTWHIVEPPSWRSGRCAQGYLEEK